MHFTDINKVGYYNNKHTVFSTGYSKEYVNICQVYLSKTTREMMVHKEIKSVILIWFLISVIKFYLFYT